MPPKLDNNRVRELIIRDLDTPEAEFTYTAKYMPNRDLYEVKTTVTMFGAEYHYTDWYNPTTRDFEL